MKVLSREFFYLFLFALLALAAFLVSQFIGAKRQSSLQEIERVMRQSSASAQRSIAQVEEQEATLALLRETRAWPDVENFDPPQWLSAIQGVSLKSVDLSSVRARVLTANAVIVDQRARQAVVAVPVEFELWVDHRDSAVVALAEYVASLGSYTEIESCRIRGIQRRAGSGGQSLRCRVLKYAMQQVPR